mgnify:CR=1 FL=1
MVLNPRRLDGGRAVAVWSVVAARLIARSSPARRVPALGLVDIGEAAQGGDDVDAVTVAQHARHGDGSGELLEIFGGRVVGHVVECDEGVSRSQQVDA